ATWLRRVLLGLSLRGCRRPRNPSSVSVSGQVPTGVSRPGGFQLAKGHRQVTGAGPAGGGAMANPSEPLTTVQPTEPGAPAGNGSYLAALKLGLPLVPVVEERHLTPTQRRAFIIADNKIALNAGWAYDILAEELPALGALGFDLGITGFSEDEIAEILASVDPPNVEEPPLPPLPAEPATRRG